MNRSSTPSLSRRGGIRSRTDLRQDSSFHLQQEQDEDSNPHCSSAAGEPTSESAALSPTALNPSRPRTKRRHGFIISRLHDMIFFFITLFLNSRLSFYLMFLGMIIILLTSQWFIFHTASSNDATVSSIWTLQDFIDAGSSHFFSFYGIDLEDEDGNGGAESSSGDDAYPSFLDGGTNGSTPYRTVKQNNGTFFSNTRYDYRECTSPENHVPWPLKGDVQSKTSNMTCGVKSSTPLSDFLHGEFWKNYIRPLTQHCLDLVVFGVAFGGDFVKDLDAPHVRKLVNATDLLQKHGQCFFIFTSKEDIERNKEHLTDQRARSGHVNDTITTTNNFDNRDDFELKFIGHNILIPIPDQALPYRNPRRNVKLLKYMGQYMFQEAKTIIWQDAKFFRDDFVSKQPRDYHSIVENACVTTMGLPVHKGTVGLENIREGILINGRYRPQYEHHCKAIITALIDRPNVTDSADNLIRQCDAYLQHVYKQQGSTETMNQGLIDSAFIVWNQKTQACRDFNDALRCTIMDQIQCHSDRDQVSIPFAMYNMGLKGWYRLHPGEELRAADPWWDPRIHDLDFVSTLDENGSVSEVLPQQKDVMIRVVRSACHWYFSQLGDCRTGLSEDKPSIAIMVAGVAKRFMFTGLIEHVIKPLVQKQNTNVDYYLMLSVKHGLSYRTDDAYMRFQTFDPAFSKMVGVKDAEKVTYYMYDRIRDNITHSGANVGGIHIQPSPMKLDPPELRKKQLENKRARPKEDSYYRFPTLDLRPEYRRRTAISNRNMFKLYLGLQKLWEKHLMTSEQYMGVKYDYVMILREDAMWLSDFNLQNLIASNPNADAYVPSCDTGSPQLAPMAFCDHGIVMRREKAAVVGRYFQQLLEMDLNKCHESVAGIALNNTGCNSEMVFRWILEQNNVTVQTVPQSLLPFERSMVINLKQGRTETCIHKFCQSRIDPLKVPSNLRICKDVPLPE
ncbi:hypothetical protein IV203_011819 [Nitzschia inconspicua]|uniref:Uncharacterized protein n=1 Tax=Nitzschia inconspicua TaxID=303405 RepID=A0A9K3KTE3_9STRA|nr:hypothetical protein IV203_011819 [Nitzschia inconspicua]